jgi:hypothetical protein
MEPPFEVSIGDVVKIINNGGSYTSAKEYAKMLGCVYWIDSFVPPNGMEGMVLDFAHVKGPEKYLISLRTKVKDIPLSSTGYASAARTKHHTKHMRSDDPVDFLMDMNSVEVVRKAAILPEDLFDI